MPQQNAGTAEGNELKIALKLMAEALDILDRNQAPADVGAHLDLALARLREYLGRLDSAIHRP